MTDESSLREVLKGLAGKWRKEGSVQDWVKLDFLKDRELPQLKRCADELEAALASQPSGVSGGHSSGPLHVDGDRIRKFIEDLEGLKTHAKESSDGVGYQEGRYRAFAAMLTALKHELAVATESPTSQSFQPKPGEHEGERERLVRVDEHLRTCTRCKANLHSHCDRWNQLMACAPQSPASSRPAKGKIMQYEVVQSKDTPNEWRVEALSGEDVFVTLFSGPLAESRAKEYAQYQTQAEKAASSRPVRGTEVSGERHTCPTGDHDDCTEMIVMESPTPEEGGGGDEQTDKRMG